MRELGFALGSIIGMALTARERRAADLNEIGIRLANEYRYEEALSYLLEAKKLMPNNADIQNNINICRQALNEKRRLLREIQKTSSEYNQEDYIQKTSQHKVKTSKSDSIKYYPTLQDIPEIPLMAFFYEKHSYFNSKSDLINHSEKYWSNKEIKDFIVEFEFFEDTTSNFKIDELYRLKLEQERERKGIVEEQKKLEEEQKILEEEQKRMKDNLYQKIQHSRTDFQNFIIDNMEELCRIYSIPKLGKTYVVNHIVDNYSPIEVWDALERYK